MPGRELKFDVLKAQHKRKMLPLTSLDEEILCCVFTCPGVTTTRRLVLQCSCRSSRRAKLDAELKANWQNHMLLSQASLWANHQGCKTGLWLACCWLSTGESPGDNVAVDSHLPSADDLTQHSHLACNPQGKYISTSACRLYLSRSDSTHHFPSQFGRVDFSLL